MPMIISLMLISVVILELAYALEITVFLMLYTPLDLVAAEVYLSTGALAKGIWVVVSGSLGLAGLQLLLRLEKSRTLIQDKLRKILLWHLVFTIIVLMKYLFFLYDVYLHIWALLSAGMAFYLILRLGYLLFDANILAWRHPTTSGFVVISGFVLAGGVTIMQGEFIEYIDAILTGLAALLIIELFILFARFRFLTHSDQNMRGIAERLLGTHILIFGGFIISGIFIPLVLIFYSMLVQPVSDHGIAVLVMVGAVCERYLFFFVTEA